MKKLFLFLGAILLSTCLWAKQGGTLTSTPSPINPSENAVINYDGTGTNFANWEPLCYVHAWLVAAEGQEFSKSYTTEWTTCNGDEEYAKLDDKVKMTYSGTKGKYSITMNIKSFFGVEDADLPKIAKLGIIVKSQWNKEDESQNVTEDLFVNVGEPQPTIYYVTGNAALVGEEKAWQADAIEMTAGTYTFKDLAAGEYQLKVTDGTWSNAWGYDALSKTVAIEGLYTDVDDNICFTVYTPNDVTVTLTEGHVVTVTGDFKAPTKYYAKNNWNGGEWSWLEMTKVEDLYVLDSVIFGGTGVNINTKEEDTDAKWFDLKKMKYNEQDTIQALDTVRFELAISKEDTVLTAIKLGRPAPAARKEFVFVAGEAADSDPALFAITWGKDGSNETVKLANKADDIYTAEILETVDSLVLVRCASDATEIIWDGEGKNVWNQTANYELCDTMYFESWVPETNLFAVTCEAPKPVETKYYAKNNWNGGEWSWLEMTKVEDLYVLDSVIFGGTGVNINTKEEDTDAKWFDLKKMKYNEQDTIQALDTVRFELAISKEDTVLTAILLGRPAPAARKEFVFVAGEAADSDPALFAITWGKDGSNETVKLANKADDIYTAEILETVDSLVLVRCASDATEIIWDGEGKNVWNQTANYELCDTMYFESWVPETNLFAVTCEAPKPVETKYYAKNNWNGAAAEEWSWLEMSATDRENIYMLDSVVFGGTGVNINDKEDDTDALWFAADAITVLDGLDGLPGPIPPEPRKRDTIPYAPARMVAPLEAPTLLAGDTIKLFFNAADSTLSAAIVGRPHIPVITYKDSVYYVAGNFTNWAAEMKALPYEVELPADSTLEFKQVLTRTILSDGDSIGKDTTWYGQENSGFYMTRGNSEWILNGEFNVFAKTDIKGMYSFSMNKEGAFVITWPYEDLKYYVTGNAALVGEEKAWNERAIEMIDSTHTFPLLAAGEYQLKVTNGTWNNAYGFANLSEKSSSGISGDVDGNICFIVETPNDVVVSIANGKVTVIGIFEQPEPVETFDLTIVQDTLWTKDGGKVAAWIWGEELAGEWTAWATNVNDTLTLKVNEKADSIILVRNAPEASEPTWDAWNRIDAGEIEDCHLLIITNWNEGVWCERPEPGTHAWYYKGYIDGQDVEPSESTMFTRGIVEFACTEKSYLMVLYRESGKPDVQYMAEVYVDGGDYCVLKNTTTVDKWGVEPYAGNLYLYEGDDANSVILSKVVIPGRKLVDGGHTPTGMNEIESNATIQKIVRDGHLYIMVNEQVYNVQGIRVQ